ncbi:class I SAM-dependent methyltransferase [Parabacteroides sp. PFB2-10]|uniref:class I SAM-dependent methyltransferase n=1 Tax=Parabacteroides sp. PFB2-10 TaxID=1742405 RepID=UPI002473A2A0|nr:class I SAM-dependent methyltransferase [Parabacteroides sp. PFB2-10]
MEKKYDTNSFMDSTVLPDWLDSYIFKELGGIYSPDYIRYEYNLDLSKEEVKTYLGTYFPRSYAESFCIFDNLLSNGNYFSEIQLKRELSILDFGCGTGGEIIGLLMALTKYHPDIENINILALDGNHYALRRLESIIDQFRLHCQYSINLIVGPIAVSDSSDIELMKDVIQGSFDYILSFKAICELISKKRIPENAYKYIAEILASKLTEKGIMVILDVTVKSPAIGTFYPIYMNNGLREFVKKSNNSFKTLIPLSCYRYERACTQECFSQRLFKITHSRKQNDLSKVSYRILGRKNFVELIMPKLLIGELIIQVKNGENIYCPLSKGVRCLSSFDINNSN